MAGSADGEEEKTVNLKVFQGIPQDPHDETNPCLPSTSNSILAQGISKHQDEEKKSPCTSTSSSESVQPLSQADVNEIKVESEGQTPNLETGAKRKRTEDEPNLHRQAKRRKIYFQFKGVVSQAPDRWGAQIYKNKDRLWLGTFKSETEAAKAYDRACIKLLGKNGTRNLPDEPIIERESLFQDQFLWEEVARMIKDHSYDDKLQRWRIDNFNPKQPLEHKSGDETLSFPGRKVTEGPMLDRKHLFDKQVTVSDVGKLNRLVIPKRHAEQYFPENKLEDFLKFVDTDDREWQFRYSFWSSSQSYVLTRGWRKFVKAKNLQEGDMISFSRDSMTTDLKFYISVNISQNFRCHRSLKIQSSSYSGDLSAIPISVNMPVETTELLDSPKEENDVIISKESPPQEKNYLSLLSADELNLGVVSFHESQKSCTSNFIRLFGCDIYGEDQNEEEEDLELKL